MNPLPLAPAARSARKAVLAATRASRVARCVTRGLAAPAESSGPDERQIELEILERLGAGLLVSGEGVDEDPVAALEPEDIDRVHVPDVAHALPGVDAHLLDLVDAPRLV